MNESITQVADRVLPILLQRLSRLPSGGLVVGGGGLVVGGGGPGSGGAPSPHPLNSVHHEGTLADGQAPQFLKLDGSRTLTGNLPVAGGITIDGVDISAHAANPSAHHAPATPGNGIVVTGQQIAVLLAATPGLEFASGLLRVHTGDGLERHSTGLRARVSNGIGRDATGIYVDLAANPGLEFNGGQLRARVANGIGRDSSGIYVDLAANPGLEFNGGQLRARVHGAITRTASGIGVAGGDGIVVTGAVHVDLADTPGLEFNAAKLRVRTGDGLERHSTGVRVALTAMPGLEFASGLLRVRAGAGIERTADGTAVRLASQSGLTLAGSVLAIATPGTLAWNSTNHVTASHTHEIATSSNPGNNAIILRSTTAGGLTLESLDVTGMVTVGQSLFTGNNTIRAIYHTHDYPHSHLIINPGPSWNLDEQFGVDIDDNLLVRGWIVGKHAIQVAGATMLVHFDGPHPFPLNFVGNATGHMGQVPTYIGTPAFYEGKFQTKCIGVTEAGTNLCRNPIMHLGDTFWSGSSAASVVSTRSFIGENSAYYAGAANSNIWRAGGYNTAVANGQKLWVSFWVYCSKPNMARVRIFDTGGSPVISASNRHANEWVMITAMWENTSGVSQNARWEVQTTDSGYLWVDACSVRIGGTPTIFASGNMPNGTWSGPGNNETTVARGVVRYEPGIVDTQSGTISVWFRVPWGDYHGGSSGKTLWCLGSVRNLEVLKFNNNPSWQLAIGGVSQGTFRLDTNGAQNTDWHQLVVTYSVADNESRVYLNGCQISSGNCPPFNDGVLSIGDRFGFNNLCGYVEELGIFSRVLDEDEIRTIYESNAPVFAETSTWHWRAGRNRVWADSEGLWAVSANQGVILGLYAGDDNDPAATKSWGGIPLKEGDFLLGNTSGAYQHWDRELGRITIGREGATTAHLFLDGDEVSIVRNAYKRVEMSSAGHFRLRDANNVIRLNVEGSDLQLRDQAGNNRLLLGTNNIVMRDHTGVDRLSINSSGFFQIFDASGVARLFVSSTIQLFDSAGTNRLWIDSNSIRLLDTGGVSRVRIDGSGALTFRDSADRLRMSLTSNDFIFYDTAGRPRLFINQDSIRLRDAGNRDRIDINSIGDVIIRDNSNIPRFSIGAAGSMFINNSNGNPVFTFDSSTGAEFTLPLTLGVNGGIWQGTGSFVSPSTGLKIWRDTSGVGRIAGFNAGTLQWENDTNGRLRAGGGNVTIDSTGIRINASTVISPPLERRIRFVDGSTVRMDFYFYSSGSSNVGVLRTHAGGNFQISASGDLFLASGTGGSGGIVVETGGNASYYSFGPTTIASAFSTVTVLRQGGTSVVPVFEVVDHPSTSLFSVFRSGQVSHGLYNERSVALSATSSGQTLTVDIIFSNLANAPYNMEVWIMSGSHGNANARAFQQRVALRQPGTVPGTMSILGSSTPFDVSSGDAPSISGPTAITQGIRYVISNTNSNTQNRGVLMLRWATRPDSTVTVNQSVS